MTVETHAVVKLTVTGTDPNCKPKPEAAGSGFVIHSSVRNSLILTAAHVVGSSDWRQALNPDWLVEPDGRMLNRRIRIGILNSHGALIDLALDAAVIHQDDQKDIAVLLVDRCDLPTIAFATNASEIIGDVQAVRVMGFRKDERTLDVREASGRLQCLPQSGLTLRIGVRLPEGISGGPVIDVTSGKVIALASVNVGASHDHHAVALFPVLSAIAPYIDYASKMLPSSADAQRGDPATRDNVQTVSGDGNIAMQGVQGSTISIGHRTGSQ